MCYELSKMNEALRVHDTNCKVKGGCASHTEGCLREVMVHIKLSEC